MTLNPAQFEISSEFLCLVVPTRQINSVLRNALISKCLRRGKNLRYVVPADQALSPLSEEEAKNVKLILFKNDIASTEDLPEDAKCAIDEAQYKVTRAKETQTYDDLSASEVLAKLLPEGVVVPTAYEAVGHIAHLNLLPAQLPHAGLIGQVLIDKNPGIRTVVNKTHNIEDEFRACPFELIAGDPDYIATVIESGFRFTIDYEKVFWNSRLSHERESLAKDVIPHGAIVCDVMAGVGAFGVYLTQLKGCEVYSNDLNPAAFSCMEANIDHNKSWGRIKPSTMDGRSFIKEMILGDENQPSILDPCQPTALQSTYSDVYKKAVLSSKRRNKRARIEVPEWKLEAERPVFFLMNLPAIAIEFLDAFRIKKELLVAKRRAVNVLVYSFAVPEEAQKSIADRVQAAFGEGVEFEIKSSREVRDVSPSKSMYCTHILVNDFM